jgi:hypothetical protein
MFFCVVIASSEGCSPTTPEASNNFYLVADTSSAQTQALSKRAVIEAFELMEEGGGKLVVDLVDQDRLNNLFSASPTDQNVRPLMKELQTIPAKPDVLPLVIQRARKIAQDLPEGEKLIVIAVSAGTDEQELLNRIHDETKRLSDLQQRSIRLVIVGVDPALRLAFSSAFQPTRTFTTFASSTEEFTTQINNLKDGE